MQSDALLCNSGLVTPYSKYDWRSSKSLSCLLGLRETP